MYDGQGNYFRKRAVTHAQGSTSLSFEKKNFAANFCNDEWLEKATPNIKFGHPEGITFYTVSGQPLQGPRRGINIVRYPDGRQLKINVK